MRWDYLSEVGAWVQGEHLKHGDAVVRPNNKRRYHVDSIIWTRSGETFVTFQELTRGKTRNTLARRLDPEQVVNK